MSKANFLRGEIDIKLQEINIKLRPTFSRLVAAECEIGSLIAFSLRAADNDIRISDAVALLWHCADNISISREEFSDLLISNGLTSILPHITKILYEIFAP
jgi:hypothetical protein